MTPAVSGAVLGGLLATGVLLVVRAVVTARGQRLAMRVYPYLRDLPGTDRLLPAVTQPGVRALFTPVLRGAADSVDRLLGGSASVRHRLARADLDLTVHDFRVQQVLWGIAAFAATAVPASLVALASPQRTVPLFLCCLVAGATGVLLRENALTAQVKRRERAILEEFPTLAELLALAVAAGESPVAALERVVARSQGEMAAELRRVLAAVRTGTPLTRAFDDLGSRTGLPAVSRFAEGLAIAVERGTPLADVLHAQAGDVREAGRRALIEAGARAEITMMVPVVFLVLPTVVVFAFFPGLLGLNLVV